MSAPTNCTAGKSFLHKTRSLQTMIWDRLARLRGVGPAFRANYVSWGVLVGPASFRDKHDVSGLTASRWPHRCREPTRCFVGRT
jgi:hypothetical protein